MPNITIQWYAGRTDQQKRELVTGITDAMVRIGKTTADQVHIPARTRYNTSGRERPLLWPVLPCPPMAGFEVSTEEQKAVDYPFLI